MRNYIDIVEGRGDDRDMEAKLRDLINHPNTEPHLRDVAQRKLDKLLHAKQQADIAAGQQAQYDSDSRQVPAPLFQVNVQKGNDLHPLPREEWDGIFADTLTHKLRTTYRQIIEAARSLGSFKVDFYPHRSGPVGYHAHIWFHPEDEPDDETPIAAALKPLKWGVAPKATYFRGGTSRYFVCPNANTKRKTK